MNSEGRAMIPPEIAAVKKHFQSCIQDRRCLCCGDAFFKDGSRVKPYSTIDKKESKARFVEFIKIAYDGGEVDAGQILTMGNSAHTGCQLDDKKCLPINSKDIWYICPTKARAGQKCTMPVEFGN